MLHGQSNLTDSRFSRQYTHFYASRHKAKFVRIIKKRFDVSVFDRLNNLYSPAEIKPWEKSKKVFKEAQEKLDPSIYKRELERFVIDLSWKSSQIEGNTYSLIETETLIKQDIKANGHSDEEAVMILNHKEAFELATKFGAGKLSSPAIRKFWGI